MLDSCRHFFPPEDVKRLLRAAACLGLNRMHWHLTDDQGWRLEIRKYPELTETGSIRGPSFFGGTDPAKNNCGFYTQEEIRDIVRFAGELGIGILPEIEIPGHASAMLAARPRIGCRRGEAGVWPNQVEVSGGIFPALLCAGKDEALRFAEDILDEVTELFPYPAVHIGGDEALKIRWRRCPDCQRRIREEGLSSEDELQRWLVLRLGEYLAKKGRKTVVWNDVLEGGPLPDRFIVQQWMGGGEKTRAFLAEGGSAICSDTAAFYLDYPYGTIDVRTIWEYPRIPDFARGYEGQLLGLECPLWTERISSLDRAAYQLFPRLAAMSVKADHPEDMPWEAFLAETKRRMKKAEALGLRGAPEKMWVMEKEAAEKDRKAEYEKIRDKDALPYVRKEEQLVLLDRTERLMEEIGIPRAFALKAGDCLLAEVYGEAAPEETRGADVLIRQLTEAMESRQWGAWKDIPEDIWLDTMKAYARFIGEHRRSYGYDGFDRGEWTVRQAGARLFRIGELEYELIEEDGEKQLSLHIPSDARLEKERLGQSVKEARAFFRERFPAWDGARIICESWLLSPVLKELLPPSSRILRFQNLFTLQSTDPEDDAALEWVFGIAQGQREGLDLRTLKEETALQRGLKARLLQGGHCGSGFGVMTGL